ncbi:right-handed parallel beta-helix repeat-containing protein [Rubrivirga marina]|uniref:Right handed beta helix domain-containing protein n=1 Tax=Rubrivirga marina TaxID=1196024 RepID=A0A271IXL7_9BACT|nr:right-handed parallel beta-helix repeat-containing protein [Rubrivirga marina]PAP75942.1 hypothetical protein BSZ37_05555 [Rubrivirga marina]
MDPNGTADATTIAGCGFAEGHAIIVRAGTYREAVRPTADRVALVAYPGHHPVVSGADVIPSGAWTPVDDDVWRHVWAWEAQDNRNGDLSPGRRRELFVVDGVVMRGVGGDRRPALPDGRFWVEGPPATPKAVYLNPPGDVDPNVAVIEVGQRPFLFVPADAAGGRCGTSRQAGSLVAGMAFRHGTSPRQRFAVCLGAADGTLLDSDVGWQNGGGVDLSGRDHTVTGNWIHDNGIEGAGGTGATDVVFAFNDVRGNGWADPNVRGHGGAGKVTRSRGLVAHHNVFADNEINGLWLDINNRNAIVAANLFERNANTGLFFELFSDSSLVVDNVCVDNRPRPNDPPEGARLAGCVRLTDAAGIVVAFNTVVEATNAALVVVIDDRSLWPCDHDGDPACGPNEARSGQNPRAPDADGRPVRSRDLVVLNNVLLARSGAASAIRVPAAVASASTWGGNLVWPSPRAERTGRAVPDPLAVFEGTTNREGTFRLATRSPARGSAVPVPPTVLSLFDAGRRRDAAAYHLTHDAWGRPRPASADVGAGVAQ